MATSRRTLVQPPSIGTSAAMGAGAIGTGGGGQSIPPPYRVGNSPMNSADAQKRASWTSPNSPMFWRFIYVGLAASYVGIFHFTLPGNLASVGTRSSGPPHGHGMAVGMYFAAWMIIVDAFRDTLVYSFGQRSTWASTLKQSL